MSTALSTGGGHLHAWSFLPTWRAHAHATRQRRQVLPALAAHERVLSRLDLPGGDVVIGTQRALYLGHHHTQWRRIAWIDVARAGWTPASASTVLQLWPVDREPASEVRVPSGAGFAAFVAERVTATQLMCRRVQLTETSSATITALREPGDDHICWQVRLHSSVDGNDPAVAIAAERALAELRALAGC